MADKNGRKDTQLKEALIKEGHRYSFIQAYRLLLYVLDKRHNASDQGNYEELSRHIRIRPELTLAFPKADVASVEVISDEKDLYRITATFLGLYGPSSPMPTFYTKDLLKEQSEDLTISRDFIDIFNDRLYKLFFQCWEFSRLFYQLYEKKDDRALFRLFCLIGFEGKYVRNIVDNPTEMLRYTGILCQFPRSAEGLRCLVAGIIGTNRVRVVQCEERSVPISEGQRIFLGASCSTLGLDAHIGESIRDNTGKFSVVIGPVDQDTYKGLLPDKKKFRVVNQAIKIYLDQPLLWDIKLLIEGKDTSMACLGDKNWSRLGYDMWIGRPLSKTYEVGFSGIN